MLKLSKNELIDLVNEGKTLWDLYEILQVTNERDYNEYIRKVFGNNYTEYNIFNDQVNLNHIKYRVLNKHSTDYITPDYLIRKLDEGKNKIDFMRIFGVITTNKLYREIKKIFELYDDIKGFENFKKRLIKNTFISTKSLDNTKEKKNNFVYLYALDFFLVNKDKEYFSVSSDKEAYILNISYYLKKFGDGEFSRKLIATYSDNSNINISNIPPIDIENNNCCTDDIELLINVAIHLKSKGKIPIIVTFNNYNYIKCLSYDIYFCSEITDEFEEELKNSNKKEKNTTSLPYVCFDTAYLIKLTKNKNMDKFLSDSTKNKVIFSYVLDDLIYKLCKEDFFELFISMLINPTLHFVPSIDCNKKFFAHFDKINFINNVLSLSLKHPNISIASEDLEIIEYAILNKLKLSKIE